jgi:hypothetical protein
VSEDGLLSEEEAALVFRRAAELDTTSGHEGRFDAATLERIGAEAGLSPEAVRRAVAEVRAGRIGPAAAAEPGVLARGPVPRRTTVERTVPADPERAAERLEAFLKSQVFRVCRRRGPLSVWEPGRGLAANVVRGIDLTDRVRLARVDGVELLVEPTSDGRTFVRVTLDLARMHRNVLSGRLAAVGLGGAGVVAAGAGVVLGAPEVALVLPAAAGTSLGSWFGTQSTYGKHLRRAIDAVELVLDELELGRR